MVTSKVNRDYPSPSSSIGLQSLLLTARMTAANVIPTPTTDNYSGAKFGLFDDQLCQLIQTLLSKALSFNCWTKLVSEEDMGQALARHQVERGVRLYNDQKQEAAVCKWKKSLRKITKDTERFVTLGYLCQALADWGQYREMLDLAFQQLDIANEVDSPHLRAEAYLNLAVGNQRLGDYNKAVSYCRQSIYNYCDESRTTGHVHLCLGHAYLGLSNFYKSIECFDVALKIAKEIRDPALEIRSYIGLGDVFGQLNDHEKSIRLYAKAYDLIKGVKTNKGMAGGCGSQSSNAGAGTYAKFLRLVLASISGPLRRLGKANEAYVCTEDAMKMALRVKDKPIQAKCLSSFADIYRTKTDVDRAFSTYELAYSIMMDIGDKPGQLEVLSGMAKTLSLMTRLGRICDCKALEINDKVLEIASILGNKV
ncbi:hypothetical protein CHUAL_005520 [Chamberlinius hualienensis]